MDVSAFRISKHLSDLVGRHVAVKVSDEPTFSPQTRTACYTVLPNQGTAVVQLDFHLLASLSGTMIGVSTLEVDKQVAAGALDETMTDASGELMNVLSAVIVSQGRAIFKGIFKSAKEYSGRAETLLRGGMFPLKLQVTPAGGKAGCIVIVSDVE